MSLYILAVLSTLFTLSLWHVLYKGVLGKLGGILFYISLAGFVLTALNLYMNDQIGVLAIFRDIIIIAGVSFFFMMVKENKILSIASLFILGSALPYMYEYLKEHQPKPTPDPSAQAISAISDSPQLDESNELLIELKPGFSIAELNKLKSEYGLEFEKAFDPVDHNQTDLDDYFAVNIPDRFTQQLAEIKSALESKRAVEWVETNEVMYYDPIESSSDVLPPPVKKYLVDDPLNVNKWEYGALELNKFYEYIVKQKIKPRKKTSLFILDTGVDGEHEDLKKQFKAFDKDSSKDDVGHGTHCAGIAASVSNNKLGISSLVPNSKFVEVSSIKVLAGFGFGTQKMIIDGMIRAIDGGADVISMSLGGKSTDAREKAYTEVVEYAALHNVIIITAAGNAARDASLFCPANSAGVIAVAAVDQNLNRTSFSNTLQHIKFGISAPGKDIFSTYPKNEYKSFSGTSMAAPYVAGLVSVLRSVRPDLSSADVFRIMHTTGKVTKEPYKTGHLIQPYEAIKLLNEEMLN